MKKLPKIYAEVGYVIVIVIIVANIIVGLFCLLIFLMYKNYILLFCSIFNFAVSLLSYLSLNLIEKIKIWRRIVRKYKRLIGYTSADQ